MKAGLLCAVAQEVSRAAERVDGAQLEAVAEEILRARRVFAAGAGRSGLCMRAFVNRLMHLGIAAHFAGDVTTPPIGRDDLFLIGSCSGRTAGLVALAEKAAAQGARLAVVTASPDSPVGALCAAKIVLPGPDAGEYGEPLQPMGSLFEQLSFLVYDALVLRLMERTGQSAQALACRHGNLE